MDRAITIYHIHLVESLIRDALILNLWISRISYLSVSFVTKDELRVTI